jgi:peptide/nickel transport system permease protein
MRTLLRRRGLRSTPATVVASALVLLLVTICALLHTILLDSALKQDITLGPVGSGVAQHLFGTDQLGRDVLALSLAGARSALEGPLIVAAGSMLIGLLLGGTAGFHGGMVDVAASRYADLLLALPPILLAIVAAGVLGGGYWVTVAVLVVLFSPSDVRLVRATVLEQTPRAYIESARVLGISSRRILYRHIAPNIVPVVAANALLNVAFALVALSSLSYLGLGVPPGSADWGRQLSDGRELLAVNPMAAILPGLLIIATATAVNLLGDWVAETLERRVAVQ